MWLPKKVSQSRLRAAENARRNRHEILKAWSQGQISRRDLLKWGIFSVGGVLVAKSGLSPFVGSACADNIPTGLPSSPLFGVQDFSHAHAALRRAARARRWRVLTPAPTAEANLTQQLLNPALEGVVAGDTGPIEGRPGGPIWAHQGFATNPPRIAVRASQEGAKTNTVYNPRSRHNSIPGINPAHAHSAEVPPGPADAESELGLDLQRHDPAEAGAWAATASRILFRHHNRLPFDVTAEQRLRPPHDHHPRAQRPPRRGERRLHRRVLLPGPVLRLPLADRAGGLPQHQHRARPIPRRRRPTAAAA